MTGRLLKYDPATRRTEQLASGFWFANGVALAADESFVVVAESTRTRVNKYGGCDTLPYRGTTHGSLWTPSLSLPFPSMTCLPTCPGHCLSGSSPTTAHLDLSPQVLAQGPQGGHH